MPEVEQPPAAEEPLGTQEAALCSGLSLTTLSMAGASSYGGELASNGSWAASTSVNAVRLNYYLDGVLRSSDERTGASGTWYFSTTGVGCGSHTFEVKAYPMVIDSSGNRTICWDAPRSVSKPVTQACPSAMLSCPYNPWVALSVDCTGYGSGGTGTYTALWREERTRFTDGYVFDSGWYVSPWGDPWRISYYCPKPSGSYTEWMKISFKVRDSSGMESPAQSFSAYCQE